MLLPTAAILAAIATVIVLFMGLNSMAVGGTYDRHHSGQLMSARVGLQLLTAVFVILAAYFAVR